MTVLPPFPVGNPVPGLSPDQRSVLMTSAVDPDWATAWGVQSNGCDLRFPGLGSDIGMTRHCETCRQQGRAKYMGPSGITPVPTVLHQGPADGPVLFVEGVLKSLCAAYVTATGALPYTVAFLNGCDGISARTKTVHGPLASGRDTVVIFDSDMATNENVAGAALRLEGHLRRAGARTVRFGRVPRVADDAHTGLDDWLAAQAPEGRAAELARIVDDADADHLDRDTFAERAEALDPPGRLSLARRTADRVCSLSLDAVWVQEWRTLLKDTCRLSGSDFDLIHKDAAERLRGEARENAHRQVREAGDEMPSPNEPLEVAHALLARKAAVGEHVRIWRGDWYVWSGTHWRPAPATELTDWLRRDLRHAWYMSAGKEPAPVPWAPTTGKVGEVLDALASLLRRGDLEEPEQGLFAANGRVAMDGTVTAPDPAVFNLTSVPYAYDPAAACPAWDAFLASSLPEQGDRDLLQEMFGYLVSGDTRQQKVFFLSGPPGSGKGTALRVLESLMGPEAVSSTSLPGLASHFGLASLIGRQVAFLPDVRFNIRSAHEAVPNILSISGEDSIPVARKNRDDWIGKLSVRIVMASNDLPSLPDASAALYRRLVVVKFGQSFAGREDYGLTDRLRLELAGILNWALAGYARLMARGRFVATASGDELARAARRESSPELSFMEDSGVVEPGAFTSSADLFTAWTLYRLEEGLTKQPSRQGLTRVLASSGPGLSAGQKKIGGQKVRGLHGFRLVPRP